MPGECVLVCARDRIPQADGFVTTPTCERPSIRTERDTSNPIRMSGEVSPVCSRNSIPQTDGTVTITKNFPNRSGGPHPAIPTPTGQRLAIRAERDAINPIRMLGEGPLVCSRYNIPETDLTPTRTCEHSPIRAERDTFNPRHISDVRCMSGECTLVFAHGHIPQTYGPVRPTRTTCESFPIRAERDAFDRTRMSGEYALVCSYNRIPETDGVVTTPTCECPPIRAERNGTDRTRMPGECALVCSYDSIQRRMVLSLLPLASVLPSGLNTTL